jgi:hypothetical protein
VWCAEPSKSKGEPGGEHALEVAVAGKRPAKAAWAVVLWSEMLARLA